MRPGDQVALNVFREPEMSDTFTVATDQLVVLPKLGGVSVRGHTPASLQDTLRSAYAVYLRNPSVEVRVLRRVAVQGAVRDPDLYMVDLTMTLEDLLAEAGGITDAGDPGRVYVHRGGERYRVPGRGGNGLLVHELRSGDRVEVGRKSWLSRNTLTAVSTAGLAFSVVLAVLDRVNRE